MAVDLKHTTAHALLLAFAALFPAGSLFQVRTGAPAGAENAAGGSLLAECVLPANPWTTPANGSMSKQGIWSDASANLGGVAGHYRLVNAAGTECEEGTITATGGNGDATLASTTVTLGGVVTVNTYTRTA